MPAPTRRKVYSNDIYTGLAAGGLFFLLVALAAVFYYMDVHYGFLGIFSA